MIACKLAALGADGVWIEGEPRRCVIALSGVNTIADLLAPMQARGVGVLHVHRSALEPMGLPEELPVPRPGEGRPPHPWAEDARWEGKHVSSPALAPSIKAGGMEVVIGAYQGGWGDPFEDAEDARELLGAHLAFTAALKGWHYRNSAAVTGWGLMHAVRTHGRHAARLAQAEFAENARPDLGKGKESGQIERPYGSWARHETAGTGATEPYVSAWDVNGQRLAACARLSLGIGGLELRKQGDFDKKLPGYHLVTHVEQPFGDLLPPIFEPGWHTTPRVAMAAYIGIAFTIKRSWVWTDHLPFLNPWYERLRDARAALAALAGFPDGNAPAQLALDALKQCYLQPLGRLSSRRAREVADPYYRPDWYDAVIGQELAREYLRLYRLAEAGIFPLAVYFDTIVLETPAPGQAPPELPVSSQLGKYKLLGSIPTAAAREALYGASGGSVAALVKALKGSTPGGAAGQNGDPPGASLRPPHGGYPNV
jgi:hypothetical protein